MLNPYVKLSPDLFASNQNNYVAQKVELSHVDGFPYYIFSPFQGGFYTRDIKLYDENSNLLEFNKDYVVSYYFKNLSKRIGLDIYQAVIILNPTVVNTVTLLARYVGGDLAYSTAVVTDYVNFWKSNPHVPYTEDYAGYEPQWKPGELDQIRWGSDRHYNLDYALFKLSRTLSFTDGVLEDTYRNKFNTLNDKLTELEIKLDRHITDQNNPHRLDLTTFDLKDVYNYKLATYEELKSGTPARYTTPKISSQVIELNYTTKYDNHTNLTGNPHEETAEDYGSYTVSYVDELLENKYKASDTVADSSKLYVNSTTNYNIVQLVSQLNLRLTNRNFIDLVNPLRLGNYLVNETSPNENVLGNQNLWITWSFLNQHNKHYLGYPVHTLDQEWSNDEDAVTEANVVFSEFKRGFVKYQVTRTVNTVKGPVEIKQVKLLHYFNNQWSPL